MGLSVISTTSASSSLAASPAAGVLAEGLPGEFASLLSGQALAALMSQPGIGNAGGTDTTEVHRRDDASKDAENSGIVGMDPAALVAMLGHAQLQTASTPHSEFGDGLNMPDNAQLPAGTPSLGANDEAPSIPSNPQLGADLPTRVDSQINQPAGSSANSLSRTTGALLNLPTEAKPDARGQLPSAASWLSNKSALGSGNNQLPVIAASPERAAIIAGEHPAPPDGITSFAGSLTAAAQQRGISTEIQTTTTKPTHVETWPQQFSEKIVWMAKNDQQAAQINISPPQLGPVQITLNLNGDSANVLFASPHAEVRQAIESSLPQLREMLASAGISLGESNVGANLAQQNQNNQFMMADKNQSTLENAILPANETAPTASSGQLPKAGRGLVDLFA
jgi:flagellar hook-length control protein FliK